MTMPRSAIKTQEAPRSHETCNELLTSIAVNVFLLETALHNDSQAFAYLARIKKDLAEAHFLTNAGKGVLQRLGASTY